MQLVLLGATGVGKSAVALELARRRGAAILSLDALQVYRGAEIGVGKPTAVERAAIPHGGLDLAEFGESFDVARYVEHAKEFLAAQAAANRPVIIVGGTGLYFRALTRGLCDAPPTPPDLRDELATMSLEKLRARLGLVDPPMLAQVDTENPRRLARAIAVKETTGRSLAVWQAEPTEPVLRDYRACWLQRPKAELDARIEARVAAMLAAGWVGEVRALAARHGVEAVMRFPGIGYREIVEALQETSEPSADLSRERAERVAGDICVATRQYAKRQLTWFRREPTLLPVTLSGADTVPSALLPL
jgi:tRNA dimethylallyltransferase